MKKKHLAFFKLIIYILCISSCFFFKNKEVEIYLIPIDFQGQIYIFYDVPKGNKEIYEGNERVYKIPKDGILLTQFKSQSGNNLFDKFYYVDEKGSRKKILSDRYKKAISKSDSLLLQAQRGMRYGFSINQKSKEGKYIQTNEDFQIVDVIWIGPNTNSFWKNKELIPPEDIAVKIGLKK